MESALWWQHVVRFGTSERKPIPIYESIIVDTEARNIFDKGPSALPMLAGVMDNQKRKSMAEVAMMQVARGLATREELSEFIQRRNRLSND